jgi:hypothetical protein
VELRILEPLEVKEDGRCKGQLHLGARLLMGDAWCRGFPGSSPYSTVRSAWAVSLAEAEGEGFEPSTDGTAGNGFRDSDPAEVETRLKQADCQRLKASMRSKCDRLEFCEF